MSIKTDVWIGKKGFRYWYYRFRDSEYYSLVVIGLTILVCVVLLFYVIIPEVSNWFSIRQEINATQQRISIIQQNIAFMTNLNRNTLNTQLQTATSALPSSKDFGSILQTVSSDAANAGVSLSNYSFQVGNLDSSNAQLTDVRYKGISEIQITLIITGTFDRIQRFIKALDTSLPLSEITAINGNGANATITLQFFQKAFPNVAFSPSIPLTAVSSSQLSLLQSLFKSNANTTVQVAPAPEGSASAVPLF
ncbi:MAG TPA: hypothetical protein VNW29_05060 [Candidatus Sulfotelmatobacter sp.]|jgi:hypothetical protein|nr:hypothetical protein [Candidatus Sulfotelmatobacter sp.]